MKKLIIKKRELPFETVVDLYLKKKPLVKKIVMPALIRWAKVNQITYTRDSFVVWLKSAKIVKFNKNKGVKNG